MSIPGLLRIPEESSHPNDRIELLNFKLETFMVPGSHRRGNCRPLSDFEKLNSLGEGNFGIVYKVREKSTNNIYALKKLKDCHSNEILPQHHLREIVNLKLFKHENIIKLIDVAVGRKFESTHLILEYCKYALFDILDDNPSYLQVPQIKNIMQQLFTGIDFIHKYHIIHRDITPTNILFNEMGVLKIADFNSSRTDTGGDLTPNIGAKWYRAPEILFGSVDYTNSVDIWSAGCVIAEMYIQRILFRGDTDFDVIESIINLLGSPTEREWPGHTRLPIFHDYNIREQRYHAFKPTFLNVSEATLSLIRAMLVYDPSKRPTAGNCLQYQYFSELPRACTPYILVSVLKASQAI